MSMGLLRGLITLALFLAFMALVFWAWSKQRKVEFDAAALLPLEEEGEETNSLVGEETEPLIRPCGPPSPARVEGNLNGPGPRHVYGSERA